MSDKYRVMIIDDEQSARNLLRGLIDWDFLDMEFVGEAASGIEAINVIDDMRPDIVFVEFIHHISSGPESVSRNGSKAKAGHGKHTGKNGVAS